VNQIADTYSTYQSQWDQARTEATSLVSKVNSTASSIADLNSQIRGVLVSGGSANELIDKRGVLITQLSGIVGASSRAMPDGTVNVMVGGNPLVTGDRAQAIQVDGSFSMGPATQEPPSGTDVIRLSWSSTGTPLALDGGSLAGTITSLQPASTGGAIADAISKLNDLATNIATTVNAIHSGGTNLASPPSATTGVDFFSLTAGVPASIGLKVAISDPNMVAAGKGANGTLDGSVADQISQLREATTSPDASWRNYVVDLGVKSEAATRKSTVFETSRASAENLQSSNASVDVDEEMTNMLSFQRAYEGSARVVTAIDQMLDTLINRTGLVGR
jgi:flagellar hook-associated protein 1 FlgK